MSPTHYNTVIILLSHYMV